MLINIDMGLQQLIKLIVKKPIKAVVTLTFPLILLYLLGLCGPSGGILIPYFLAGLPWNILMAKFTSLFTNLSQNSQSDPSCVNFLEILFLLASIYINIYLLHRYGKKHAEKGDGA